MALAGVRVPAIMRRAIPAATMVLLGSTFGACRCSKSAPPEDDGGALASASEEAGSGAAAGASGGLSAPIAATVLDDGQVLVAGLDVPLASIRLQKISAKDAVVEERTVLEGVGWSSDADLRLASAGPGAMLTWRGKRAGKLVKQLTFLGPDLAPKGDAVDVSVGSCATRDGLWSTDGKRIDGRSWAGESTHANLPQEEDPELVCGQHRAFAMVDGEEGTSLWFLGSAMPDGGAVTARGGKSTPVPLTGPLPLLRESDYGDDEQRERGSFTVGDDLGVVRLSVAGALTLREVRDGQAQAPRSLTHKIGKDDDLVAVDASRLALTIVYTSDGGESCRSDGGAVRSKPKVMALRVDRATFEEHVFELSPGECGREVGPFFTGALGDAVSVAWVERVPVLGKSSAPIAGLAHRKVPGQGTIIEPLVRLVEPADALVDAGCDGSRCYAVALARQPHADNMVPGWAKVIRF